MLHAIQTMSITKKSMPITDLSIMVISLSFLSLVLFPTLISGQGNGNIIALRTTPHDEVVPIPNFPPPSYIDYRIHLLVYYFFDTPSDQAEAEEILYTIWYYNPIYTMLSTVDRIRSNNYAYAEYGDGCEEDSGGDEIVAEQTQIDKEREMMKPTPIATGDYFFSLDAWWEILENTLDNTWKYNQNIAWKVCDFRRRGLMCVNSPSGGLRCDCPKTENGVQMVAERGGICGIEKGQRCDYDSASREMDDVYDTEVNNEKLQDKTCFGNSYCTGDDRDPNSTTCLCTSIMTTEVRARGSVLLNFTIGGSRCQIVEKQEFTKWGKWHIILTCFWIFIPLFIILAPHWDDIYHRILPGYIMHYCLNSEDLLPEDLPLETYDVKMDPEVKALIEANAVPLDPDDPDYYEKVDEIDAKPLGPYERYISTPHCTDSFYHFEWPVVEKLPSWF